MKLQELRTFCTVVDTGMNLSHAAELLCATQPAISKQIRQLEDGLGTALLLRSKNRVLGLTDIGEEVLRHARNIVAETEDIQRLVGDHLQRASTCFSIATAQTHARYALHDIISELASRRPPVRLTVLQMSPREIAEQVAAGKVELGISTIRDSVPPHLVAIPCYELRHVLVGRTGHPIFRQQCLDIVSLAAIPLITYGDQHAITRRIFSAFEAAGVKAQIAVDGADDVELMKFYAGNGLGLAVIPEIAYAPDRDIGIEARNVDHLFPPTMACILVRRGAYWSRHLYEFVERINPALTRQAIQEMLEPPRP